MIIRKFLESEGFKKIGGESEEEESEDEYIGEKYNTIIGILENQGIKIEKHEIIRIKRILGYLPEQIYDKDFILEYWEVDDEDDNIIKIDLINWIREYEDKQKSDDDDENVIKTLLE